MILKTAPNDNWLIDTRNTEVKQQDEITKKVNRLTRVPRNSPVLVNQTFVATAGGPINGGYRAVQNLSVDANGYAGTSFPAGPGVATKPAQDFKLANVNDAQLDVSLTIPIINASGYPGYADSNFDIDFYFQLAMIENTNGNPYIDWIDDGFDTLISAKFTCSFFEDPDPLNLVNQFRFSFANSNQNFRLFDTAPDIATGGNPSITADPSKITPQQLDQIINKSNSYFYFLGFDVAQRNALGVNNQAYFDDLFNNGLGVPGDLFNIFGLRVDCNLSFFGTASNYETFNS
jgi:hypothetical protein